MIVHASLKTDIPAYYLKWFLKRLDEGFFDLHGEKANEVIRQDISKNDKIIFHTRDPLNFNKEMRKICKEIKDFELITNIVLYDKYYHPKTRSFDKIIASIRTAADSIKDKNSFCYGPIFETNNNDVEWHINQFRFICSLLHKDVAKAYISFYHKPDSNYNGITVKGLSSEKRDYVMKRCTVIANNYNLPLFEQKSADELPPEEIDIGEVNACPGECAYCKYNTNPSAAKSKYSIHDAESSLMIGLPPFDAVVNCVSRKDDFDFTTLLDADIVW